MDLTKIKEFEDPRHVANSVLNSEFKFDKLLGKGSFGSVFKIINKNTNKIYAIKMIDISKLSSQSFVNLKREVLLLNYIQKQYKKGLLGKKCYPHISCIYDSFISDYEGKKNFCILMEYVEGYPLDKYIKCMEKTEYVIPSDQLIKFMRVMMETLVFLHKINILHSDIKPANIIFNNKNIKLVDFGVSCATLPFILVSCQTASGSLPYFPPEIIEYYDPIKVSGKLGLTKHIKEIYGKDLQLMKSFDIWSMGVVFFELANHIPYYGGKIKKFDVFKTKLMNKELIQSSYTYKNSKIDKEINNIIMECLTYDFKKRPTADKLLKKIKKLEQKTI